MCSSQVLLISLLENPVIPGKNQTAVFHNTDGCSRDIPILYHLFKICIQCTKVHLRSFLRMNGEENYQEKENELMGIFHGFTVCFQTVWNLLHRFRLLMN